MAIRGWIFAATCLIAILAAVVWFGLPWATSGVRDDWPAIQAALQAQQWDRAEAALRARVAGHPEDQEARFRWGQVLGLLGHEDESRTALEAIAADDPNRGKARFLLGEIARQAGDVASAEAAYRESIRLDPDSITPHLKLVELLFLEWRKPEVIAELRELDRIEGDSKHLLARTGLAAERALPQLLRDVGGEFSQFTKELDKLLERRPDEPRLRRARGLVWMARGEPRRALDDLLFAASQFEGDSDGRLTLAECHLALGDPDASAQALGPPPADSIDLGRWHLLLGQIREAQGQVEDAVAAWKAAILADPRNVGAHHRLASALSALGKGEEAAHYLEMSESTRQFAARMKLMVHDFPTDVPDARISEDFAAICLGLGLEIEARDWYRKAIRLDPTRQDAQIAFAKLGGIREPVAMPLRIRDAAPEIRNDSRPSKESAGLSLGLLDRAAERGVNFAYDPRDRGDLFLVDTMGGGVALIDYDQDGRLDLYFVDGGPLDPTQPGTNRLFRNRADGTFEDVTAQAGVAGFGYGMGAAVGDYDNDGDDDLLVTGYRRTTLYRNRGDGTFEDVTTAAGVQSDRWSTAAGFADLDGDGHLDLVVVTYVETDPKTAPPCRDSVGRPIHCPPGKFPAQADHLFRNQGDGTFRDVAEAAGFLAPEGRGLGLAITDLDGDGLLDVYVANDSVPDHMYRNLGNWRFEERGLEAGLAFNGDGQTTASMGVVAEDLDGDELPDILHTNFRYEGSTLHRNLGAGLFADITAAAGLDAPSRPMTGFGVAAADLDNDGDLDLVVANGHVDDLSAAGQPMAQLPQVFEAIKPGRFALSPAQGYFSRPVVGRGLAVGDLNDDGRVDVIVVHRDVPAALLANEIQGGHWMGLSLKGKPPACPTAIGAVVTCRVGERSMSRRLTAGTSYLASSDRRLHFGLGDAKTVDSLEVRWPSGVVERWTNLPGDRYWELIEGKSEPKPLSGPADEP